MPNRVIDPRSGQILQQELSASAGEWMAAREWAPITRRLGLFYSASG